MKSISSKILISVTFILGISLFFFLYKKDQRGSQESPQQIETVEKKREKLSSEKVDGFSYSYEKGRKAKYSFSQTTLVILKEGENSQGAGANTKMIVSGDLEETIHDMDKDKVLMGLRVNLKDFSMGGEGSPEEVKFKELLAKHLGKEIFIQMTPERSFQNFFFPQGYLSEAKNIIKSLYLSTQVSLKKNKPLISGQEFQRKETNMTGPYLAEYLYLGKKNNEIHLGKRILEYLPPDEALEELGNPQDVIVLPGGSIDITLDSQKGLISQIQYLEQNLIHSMDFVIEAHLQNKLSLKNITKVTSNLVSLANPNWAQKKFYGSPLIGGDLDPEQRKKVLRKRLAGGNLDDLLNNIQKQEILLSGEKRYKLFRKLNAWLELNPSDILLVKDFINGLDPESPQYPEMVSTLFGSLSTMKGEVAAPVLMEFIENNPENELVTAQSFGALGDLKEPTSETKDFLLSKLQGDKKSYIYSQAALTLGSLSKKASGKNSPLSLESFSRLKSELEGSENDGAILTLLTSLGNTGHPKTIEVAKEFLNHKNPDIRKAAILSLENTRGKKVREFVGEILKKDQDPENRKVALYVLAQGKEDQEKLNVAKEILNHEKNEEILMGALNLVNRHSKYFKDQVIPFLKEVKTSHENPKIRNHAEDLLLTQ